VILKSINCSNCGAGLELSGGINEIFCSYCGTQNWLTDVLDVPGGLVCMSCNTRNKEDNLYCQKCGLSLKKQCPFCSEMHPLNIEYCFRTGRSIKEYEDEIKEYCASIHRNIVFIHGGSFFMGQKDIVEPVRKVNLYNFYISKYEVTNKEFCIFLNSEGNQIEGGVEWILIKDDRHAGIKFEKKSFMVKPGYENHPVVYVSWYGAVAYCNWLSHLYNLTKCYGNIDRGIEISEKGYRLPTEAEWEYACRSGSSAQYYWGNNMDGSCCWYSDNSSENHHPVGQKKPNTFGLYDMLGNVWEWCNDSNGDYPFLFCPSCGAKNKDENKFCGRCGARLLKKRVSENMVNPVGSVTGVRRIIRGGGWSTIARNCTAAYRILEKPANRYNFLGFRLARTS